MFLCVYCHEQGQCWRIRITESVSSGLCEKCGVWAVCSDCHNYDFSASAGDAK